jgi:hypothetical protein
MCSRPWIPGSLLEGKLGRVLGAMEKLYVHILCLVYFTESLIRCPATDTEIEILQAPQFRQNQVLEPHRIQLHVNKKSRKKFR